MIGQLGDAMLVETSAKVELDTMTELKSEGATTQDEFQQSNLKHEIAKQRTAMLRQQVGSIRAKLQEDL